MNEFLSEEIPFNDIPHDEFLLLTRWNGEKYNSKTEIYFQIEECDKIRKEKFKNRSSEDKPKSFKIHPQAIYTSRLLNFKNLPKPVNSDTSYTAQSTSVNPKCLDVQLSELELNEICQDDEYNIE
ncbi:unnamed protein product [Rhizophagus irregularis]|uniref:Uncharacterized protein n=1 Tax=Rhizophagus irregularis TaxID=588596 RepID=A0A916E815_9GLOM|nr:unnamed protein product [Rhizophagus irregularis]